MLQKTTILGSPFQLTAWRAVQQFPSKARFGKASIMNFKELPEGMAGVIPTIFSFFRAKSNIVNQKRLGISEEGFLFYGFHLY
jgi:hypothetical protein